MTWGKGKHLGSQNRQSEGPASQEVPAFVQRASTLWRSLWTGDIKYGLFLSPSNCSRYKLAQQGQRLCVTDGQCRLPWLLAWPQASPIHSKAQSGPIGETGGWGCVGKLVATREGDGDGASWGRRQMQLCRSAKTDASTVGPQNPLLTPPCLQRVCPTTLVARLTPGIPAEGDTWSICDYFCQKPQHPGPGVRGGSLVGSLSHPSTLEAHFGWGRQWTWALGGAVKPAGSPPTPTRAPDSLQRNLWCPCAPALWLSAAKGGPGRMLEGGKRHWGLDSWAPTHSSHRLATPLGRRSLLLTRKPSPAWTGEYPGGSPVASWHPASISVNSHQIVLIWPSHVSKLEPRQSVVRRHRAWWMLLFSSAGHSLGRTGVPPSHPPPCWGTGVFPHAASAPHSAEQVREQETGTPPHQG